MNPQSDSPTQRGVRQVLGIAWGLMVGFRLRFLLAIGAMLAATGLRFLVPLVGSGTIDYALGAGDGTSQVVQFMRRFIEQSWLAGNLWAAGLLMVGLTQIGRAHV